jgi:hypothetical protein
MIVLNTNIPPIKPVFINSEEQFFQIFGKPYNYLIEVRKEKIIKIIKRFNDAA